MERSEQGKEGGSWVGAGGRPPPPTRAPFSFGERAKPGAEQAPGMQGGRLSGGAVIVGLGGAGQSWVCCGGGCFYAEQMMCLDKTVRLTDLRVPRAGEKERPLVQGDCPIWGNAGWGTLASKSAGERGRGSPGRGVERAVPQETMPAHS